MQQQILFRFHCQSHETCGKMDLSIRPEWNHRTLILNFSRRFCQSEERQTPSGTLTSAIDSIDSIQIDLEFVLLQICELSSASPATPKTIGAIYSFHITGSFQRRVSQSKSECSRSTALFALCHSSRVNLLEWYYGSSKSCLWIDSKNCRSSHGNLQLFVSFCILF